MNIEISRSTFGFVFLLALAVGLTARESTADGRDAGLKSESCASGTSSPRNSTDEPIAVVAGQPIYERNVVETIAAQMLQLHQQEYQVKSKALEGLISEKLLEVEAQKRGISTDKLEEEVDSKVTEPTDAEVEGYYLAVRNQINQPLEAVRPQLRKALKLLKIQQARQDFADSLRAKADIAILLQPPKVDVGYDPARVRGNPHAPVTIVEFSDFQCPYCKRSAITMKDLLAKYKGQIKLAFRDFPMRTLHPQAQMAAEAGRCAEEQGKFWEYHDALFATDQSKLNEASLIAAAQSIGLDEKAFTSCLASGRFKAQVEKDVQDGTRAGVSGTPGFFINGEFVSGAQPESDFVRIIDRELSAAGDKNGMRASR